LSEAIGVAKEMEKFEVNLTFPPRKRTCPHFRNKATCQTDTSGGKILIQAGKQEKTTSELEVET
jgi:hypothetical protein